MLRQQINEALKSAMKEKNSRSLATLRLILAAIKDRDEIVGNATRVKVVKNKVAPPFKQVEFDIMYGEGISKNGELLDLGVTAGVVEKSGAWYSYGDERIGQGRENAKIFLSENSKIAYELEDKIRAAHGLDFETSIPKDDGKILEA